MIGVFDSGVGGLAALAVLHRLMPRENAVYLADRKNLPYGEKSEGELVALVSRDIERLVELGCRRVLIACCTASSVYHRLSPEHRAVSLPIIAPAAERTGGGRVTVIATERTVSSHAFRREILKIYPDARVTEIAAQSLVSLVEGGVGERTPDRDEREKIEKIIEKIAAARPDALLLGCTHFSHVKEYFVAALPSVRMVDAAEWGARAFCEEISELPEEGVCRYIE